MWHKVNPVSFRIPYIKPWAANWYSDKKDYTKQIVKDNKIREILKKELSWIPVWDIVIWRKDGKIEVTIFTIKALLILWASWENLTRVEKILGNKSGLVVKITVKEIKKPDANAKIVGFNIVNQIEKRMPYKRAIKQAIQKSMEKWVKWIKVKVGWRLNWAEIARKETFKDWNTPTQTIRADIDYCSVRAETVYWTIWIKVWIYKGDIFKTKK